MNNSALDGAAFGGRFQQFDHYAKDAYNHDLRVVAFYSYGDELAHHATVIRCADGGAYRIEILGNGDQPNMFLRTKNTRWDPAFGEAVFKVSGITFKRVYDHALQCCDNFGTYNAATNNCQTWNNRFLEIFEVKRRTVWSWISAGVVTTISAIGIFLFMLPASMTITN